MSQISSAALRSERTATRVFSWGAWPIAVVAAALAAAFANTVVRIVAVVALDVPDEFEPLTPSSPVTSSVIAAAGAGLVLAGLARFTGQPIRYFFITSGVFFVLSFAPLVQLGLADPPEFPGTTGGTLTVLALMHVVALVTIVPLLAKYSFRQPAGG